MYGLFRVSLYLGYKKVKLSWRGKIKDQGVLRHFKVNLMNNFQSGLDLILISEHFHKEELFIV